MRSPGDATRIRSALRAAMDDAGAAGQHPDEGILARYLSRELDPAEIEAMEVHLAACPRCAEELIVAADIEEGSAESPTESIAAGPATPIDSSFRRPARAPRDARRRSSARFLRIAAALAIVTTTVLLAAAGSQMALRKLEPILVNGLSRAMGRDVKAGGSGFVLAGGPGVRIEDVTIGDDPRFSSDAFVRVGAAVLQVDPRALLSGRVRGAVRLDDPSVSFVRDSAGRWNVQTLGGKDLESVSTEVPVGAPPSGPKGERSASTDGGRERPVRLTSATIRNGTLALTDERPAARQRRTVLHDVNATFSSSDPSRPGTLSLDGFVGEGEHRIALSGEIGPFEGADAPRYELRTVALDHVPLDQIPGAPQTLSGELSFGGHVSSEGSGLERVLANADGSGNLNLCCGSILDRNLGDELLAALDREMQAGEARGNDVGAAARRDATVAAALDQRQTSFSDLGGSVTIKSGVLEFNELTLQTSLFRATASGSLTQAGGLEARGDVQIGPDLARAIAAAAPQLRGLSIGDSGLAVPFTVAGTWPNVRMHVDVRQALANLPSPLARHGLTIFRDPTARAGFLGLPPIC